MAKQLMYNDEARKKVMEGIDKVANAVKITLGPKGRNVVLDKGFGAPNITNDGVTIAKEIDLEDKFENVGAELVKEVANKTNDTAGDGTTTSVLITQAIVKEGLKYITTGINPVGIRQGMEKAKDAVIRELKKNSKKISSKEEMAQVAAISAEDEKMGKMIADVIGEVGKEGVVDVQESQTFGFSKEIVEGMRFDKGYVSHYMVTDAQAMEAVLKEPYILITNKKIASVSEILPILEKVTATGKKEMVIIAEDIEGEALATLVVNKLRGALNVLAVKAPEFGDSRKDMLEDIAILTGGQVISEEKGVKLETIELSMLGKAGKVISTKDETMIVDGKGKKTDIAKRVEFIKEQIKKADSNWDKEKLQKRLAKLAGGVAVIKVGAASETELEYIKAKMEDALAATRAAAAEMIEKKIAKAVTDSGSEIIYSDEKPAIKNLLNIYSLLSDKSVTEIVKNYKGKGYADFKKGLTKVITDFIMPLQTKMKKLDDKQVLEILAEGAQRAKKIASQKMAKVKEKVGFLKE